LTAARDCFAELGYAATSNRIIADRAGLTPAALYHHFGRKRDLMFAVQRETAAAVYQQMVRAAHGHEGMVERVAAVLEALHSVLMHEPGEATFGFVARDEARRHPELDGLLEDSLFARLFAEIVATAVDAGELAPQDRGGARGALAVLSLGLAAVARDMDPETHAEVTDLCARLVAGDLLRSA
jgi:AcrR family transcriptional regulator